MKATSQKKLFVEMTPSQAASVNGGSGSSTSHSSIDVGVSSNSNKKVVVAYYGVII